MLMCALCLYLLPTGAAGVVTALEAPAAGFRSPDAYAWFDLYVATEPLGSVTRLEAAQPAFAPATAASVNLGFSAAEAWARFTVRYAPGRTTPLALVLPKPLVDEVELVAINDGRVIQHVATGDARAFSTRPLGYRAFAFELEPLAGGAVTYYVRARSQTSALALPLRIMEGVSFRQRLARENFFIGGYFGVLGALAVAATVLFGLLRHRVFLDYALYIVAFTAMIAAVSGHAMMLLWPFSPDAQQILPTLLVTIAIAAGLRFMDSFLHLERWPWLRVLLCLPLLVAIAGSGLHLVGTTPLGTTLVIGAGLALCPLVVVACLVASRAGDRFARFLLVGWLAYVCGVTTAALGMFGVMAHSMLTDYGLYIGTVVEFVALMLALGALLLSAQREREAEIARTNAAFAGLNQNLESLVLARTSELEARNRELGELAIRDGLTGLYNHSASIELLDQVLNQSQRYAFPVTALMLDIDHFKVVNDTYGHQVGDSVLELVARALLDAVRDSDIVGRYGGEEFLIVMPYADAPAAREFGERLLQRMREIIIPGSAGKHLSASIGIVVCHPHSQRMAAADVIQHADAALYRSKRDGRDRLTVDGPNLVAEASGEARRGSS